MLREIERKKDLREALRHGTTVFPLASYTWEHEPLDHRAALHWHPEVELVRFVHGDFNYALNAAESRYVSGPAILIIPGNVLHTLYLPKETRQEAVVFDLSMLTFEHYDELQSDVFEALKSGNLPQPSLITPEMPFFKEADALVAYLVAHAQDAGAAERLLIKAKILEFLCLCYAKGVISRKAVALKVGEKGRQDRLKKLLSYIDDHYAGPLTVSDAAARLNVSVQYFCRYFKKITGMSFTEYLNDLRLRRAARAILEGDLPIDAIASMHGFDNKGYFFKNFKQKFGMTPLKYRKSQRTTGLAGTHDG